MVHTVMALARLLIPPDALEQNQINIRGRDALHLAGPLRMRPGQKLHVYASHTGTDYLICLTAVAPDLVQGDIEEETAKPDQLDPQPVVLLQAILHSDMELTVAAATELGVEEIIPVLTGRSLTSATEKRHKQVTRWQKTAADAAATSWRTHIPVILPVMTLEEALKRQSPTSIIACHVHPATRPLTETVPASGAISLVIGPEGGLAPPDVALLEKYGAAFSHLGNRPMRARVAAPLALALVRQVTGGWKEAPEELED